MGINADAIGILRLASRTEPLGKVVTMGRMGLHVSESDLRAMGYQKGFGKFCEDFLIANFGASGVESIDYSDFEGATHIADLNKPLDIPANYDTVIDSGTLEHVFNVVQALKNVSQICKVGGRIIHIVPANNLLNHGFWQFSPELFFSLYCAKNGFAETKVFLSDVGNKECWYEATAPRNGHWDYLASSRALYVIVITRKVEQIENWDVQQSQYVNDWQDSSFEPVKPSAIKRLIKQSPLARPLQWIYRRLSDPDRFLTQNANLKRIQTNVE